MSKENPNELKIINKNERLKYQKLLYKYKQQIAELKAKNQQLQQQLKDNTKQVCEKIREWVAEHTLDFWTCENDDLDAELYEFLDQIEKGK